MKRICGLVFVLLFVFCNTSWADTYNYTATSGNWSTLASWFDATTDLPFGAILEGAGTTSKSSIAVAAGGFRGTVRLKLDATPGTVKTGTLLQTTATGTVKADAGSGSRVLIAQALEAGNANELIEAVLFKPISL